MPTSPSRKSTAKDLNGNKYNRLTVVSCAGNDKNSCRLWNCICDCGKKIVVRSGSLLSGHTKSCGCYNIEKIKQRTTIHGYHGQKEYVTYKCMVNRCYDKKNASYLGYRGKGITVCDRWLNSYENFLLDMGKMPSANHSLDRIYNEGNYEPSNCKWSTKIEQARNRSNNKLNDIQVTLIKIIINNIVPEKGCWTKLAKLANVSLSTIYDIRKGKTWT